MPEAIPAELKDLRQRLERFVAEELASLAIEGGAEVPEETRARVRELSKKAGLFNLTQPREFGGADSGPLARVVVLETIAAANSPLGRFVLGPAPGLMARATGPLRERYLDPVLRGELRGAFAFTEPSGPEAPPRPTWARRQGDLLLITGRKSYVSGGDSADYYLTLVNVEPDAGHPGGPALAVVPSEAPGVRIERKFRSLDGSHHVSLSFEAAPVAATNIIGKVGEGMQGALGSITEERLDISATACGMAQWTVGYVAAHVTAPHPSGQRLGDREGVRLRFSDMQLDTYVARAALYRTARLADAGADVMNEAMAAKVFCTEALARVVDAGVQLVGGGALVVGHPLEDLYRRARSLRLAGGASDVLRLNTARGRIEFGAGRV